MISKLIEVRPQQNYQLYVVFEDGVTGTIDLTPTAENPRYELFRDSNYFTSARIENNAIIWDDRMDMCGDYAHIQITGNNPFIS